MGQNVYTWCILALLLWVHISAVPYAEENVFLRSAVETIPPHQPIATPVRGSVESIPPRNLRDEADERVPLRDAVERRPIITPDRSNLYRYIEEPESGVDDVNSLRNYYGAATYLNVPHKNDERLQQGNENLHEMQQTASSGPGRRLVVCYIESWAAYRAPPLAFTAGLVPKSCTHLHYAFATLHPHTYAIIPTNEDYDLVKGGYRIATGLKRRMPGLKVLLSVGGGGTDRLFSEMVKYTAGRRMFVDSAVEFLKEHDFDGLDLHWVYSGDNDNEKDQLTTLLYELREKFSSYGFLLSTVLPPFRYQIEDGYDISAVSGATDYAILQAWDMTHKNTDEAPTRALQHSALHRDPGASARDQKYDNIEFMVKFIIRRGMPAEKLVLGVPLFGRSYTLAASTLPAAGAPVTGWGDEGPYTQTKGLLAFFEICMMELEGKGASGIDEDGNAYAVYGNQWISYDSPITIVEKMKFVLSTGLAGAAAWAIDMDDFRGLCGTPFPILSAISVSLNGESVQTDQSSLKIGSCEADEPYLSSDEVSCAHFHFCTGGSNYKLVCEDERLYDPATGFCGHQDVTKCVPGQSLRITVDDAYRNLPQAYETDFEWNGQAVKEMMMLHNKEQLVDPKKTSSTSSSFDNQCDCNAHKLHLTSTLPDYQTEVINTGNRESSLYGIEYYKQPQTTSDGSNLGAFSNKGKPLSFNNNDTFQTLDPSKIKHQDFLKINTPVTYNPENNFETKPNQRNSVITVNPQQIIYLPVPIPPDNFQKDGILNYGVEYYKQPGTASHYLKFQTKYENKDLGMMEYGRNFQTRFNNPPHTDEKNTEMREFERNFQTRFNNPPPTTNIDNLYVQTPRMESENEHARKKIPIKNTNMGVIHVDPSFNDINNRLIDNFYLNKTGRFIKKNNGQVLDAMGVYESKPLYPGSHNENSKFGVEYYKNPLQLSDGTHFGAFYSNGKPLSFVDNNTQVSSIELNKNTATINNKPTVGPQIIPAQQILPKPGIHPEVTTTPLHRPYQYLSNYKPKPTTYGNANINYGVEYYKHPNQVTDGSNFGAFSSSGEPLSFAKNNNLQTTDNTGQNYVYTNPATIYNLQNNTGVIQTKPNNVTPLRPSSDNTVQQNIPTQPITNSPIPRLPKNEIMFNYVLKPPKSNKETNINFGIEYYKHPEQASDGSHLGAFSKNGAPQTFQNICVDKYELNSNKNNNYQIQTTNTVLSQPSDARINHFQFLINKNKLPYQENNKHEPYFVITNYNKAPFSNPTETIHNDEIQYPDENDFQTEVYTPAGGNDGNDKKVVCYITSWSFYRRGEGKFVPEHIDTRLCTHVVYAYASLTPDDLVVKEFDPWADTTNNLYERVTSLKDVKVLLGLGGWTDSAGDKYSRLVSSGATRANFIQKLVAFLRNNNFQGLHLDWNYPVCWQSNCKKGAVSDKANFAKLVQELSKALHSSNMELGISVSGYKEVIEAAYDLPTLSKAVDFMSTMTYDYHGGWERTTAHHTPLIASSRNALSYYSIEYAIKSLISGGADPKKLMLGLSFYGQSYRLADAEGSKGPGAPAAGPGEPGEFTKQPGMLAYYEICYRVKNLRWKTGHADHAGPYTYSDSQWVGYDDPKSITEKVEWAMRQGLGGVTAWAIDLDDFNNRCCAEPSPLLRAAGRALGRSVPNPPSSPCERPTPPVTPAPPTTTTVAADGSMVGGAGGSHDHGSHGDHTSTTWPSWNPAATSMTPSTTPSTMMTWWPQSTTTSTTTTRKPTTTKRPTTAASIDTGLVEGSTCIAGEYRAAPGDCEAYLQCEGGRWTKHRCAPGLHWASMSGRCDWPSSANCKEGDTSQASTATSTLAPMTSRPPPPSPTTTRRTTTSTTTTTTTTKRPTTTTRRTTTTESSSSEAESEGDSCTGQELKEKVGDCNAYLQCDGTSWRIQRCAPGLHFSPSMKHCDWPKYAKCEDLAEKPTTSAPKPTRPPRPVRPTTTMSPSDKAIEDGPCDTSQSHASSSSCETYLLCVSGTWRKQNCPPGLHWDNRSKRCDWMEFAMCDVKSQRPTKATTLRPITTRRPTHTRPQTHTTRRPITAADDSMKPGMPCRTGSYHAHPRCDKFFVCVNGMLVAQSCAPGLVWNARNAQCDFPSSTSCSDKRLTADGKPDGTSMQLTMCDTGAYAPHTGDCTKYKHCLYGRFQEFSCSAGLHWNQERQICDWPKNAKCKKRVSKPSKPSSVNQITSAAMKPQVIKPVTTKPVSSQHTATMSPVGDNKNGLLKSHYKLVCYFTNWAWYRPGLGQYGPEDIDPSLCTHIIYGFAVLGEDGLITAHDPWADYDNRFYEKVVEYKRYGIKVSLALGGWNDSAGDKYSKLVNDPEARARFVTHAVEFIEQYGFDGLDLDWEYPKCWQVDCSKGPDTDKEGFASLVKELSAVMKPKGLLLSSAVSPNKKVIDAGYDVPVLAKHLDWIAVMTYDYHGQWDKKTGHVAPLYYHPDDDNTYFNANYTIHYWMKRGAPAAKLVMGMPMYGQTFTTGTEWNTSPDLMAKENATGLNIPAISAGEAGEYTRAKGFLAYYEICERIKDKGWMVVKDEYRRMGPYAFKGNQWVSYDDVSILKKKVNFIKSLKLGGGMVWALDLDDYRNRCGQGKHPLLNAIKSGLLDPNVHKDHTMSQSIIEPPLSDRYNDDLDDIEVRPSYTKKPTTTARPIFTTQMIPERTTKIPVMAITPEKEEQFKVVCYYTNWAWYRPESGKYSPSDVDPALCTHIVYAFAVLDSSKLIIKPHDTWLDVENKFYEKVIALKVHGIKVLLGLGGWNDSAGDKYSRLVNSPSARRTFVVHALDFLEQYGFDGLDLDWEYPKCWQVECEKGPSSDKKGFADLVQELRTAFTPRGFLLSAAVSPSKRVIDAGYDVPVLSKNLDWIAVMTYDYHGQWDKKTGHVAPMYMSEADDDQTFNANYTIHYYMQKGASRRKLVMGVPMYGQSFSLVEYAGTGLGAPAIAGGEAGDETRARGFLAFYEICERIRARGWKVTRDPGGRMGPYATMDDQWVSFDDDYMVRHKAEYVKHMGLGGSMVWSMDLDDFTGKYCGCGKAPLLKNINHVLRGTKAPPACELKEIQVLADDEQPVSIDVGSVDTTTEPEETQVVVVPNIDAEDVDSENNADSLDGKPCSGIKFEANPKECNKYYLCNNDRYIKLTCPEPLYWNKNHCDWASKSNCKSKAQLRLTNVENSPELNEEKPIIACYFSNWAYYRHGHGRFGPEEVDASLCTHIVYSWAHLDLDSSELIPGNPELDLENNFYGRITEHRLKGIKVIIGAGGLEDSEGDKWSTIAADVRRRNIFVQSVLKFLKQWEFDGLQLAWQYPVCMQVPCKVVREADRENFSMLLLELSDAMRPMGYELSAMVAASPEIAAVAYDTHILIATVDWLAVAANDFYASSTGQTSYLVSLETSDDLRSFNASLAYWSSVAPTRQLVISVPSYARSYTLRHPSPSASPGAMVSGPGEPGSYTNVPGFLAFYEVCSGIKNHKWKETKTVDGTYATSGSQWASYLRPEEVERIASSVRLAGARGAALWALDLDDWRGACGCKAHPMLRALRRGLLDLEIESTCHL